MARQKTYICILDCETTRQRKIKGILEPRHLFDLGFVIGDLHGNIVERHQYIVAENFISRELYYANKKNLYIDRLTDDKYPCKFKKASQVIEELSKLLDKWNVKIVYAFNAMFDSKEVERLATLAGVENPLEKRKINCLWTMACQVILNCDEYREFCFQNGFVSEKGNVKTSAETTYAFITSNPMFVEEHTALEDSHIEYDIFLEIRKRGKGKKFISDIIAMPWIFAQSVEQLLKSPKSVQSRARKLGKVF